MVEQGTAPPAAAKDLSALVVTLLKGVIYQEGDATLWHALLNLQARVRDFVAVLGLDLVFDESEGYAYLRSRQESDDDGEAKIPRLVARRPLSYPVSLVLALLRKKLAEFDAVGGDTRLILSRDEIVDLVRVFLPESSNDTRVIDQIETHLNKIVDMGFLRKLKPTAGHSGGAGTMYEVSRILKSFVDAQWLANFDARLAQYRQAGNPEPAEL